MKRNTNTSLLKYPNKCFWIFRKEFSSEIKWRGRGREDPKIILDRLGATTESSTYAREVDPTWRESQHNFSAE